MLSVPLRRPPDNTPVFLQYPRPLSLQTPADTAGKLQTNFSLHRPYIQPLPYIWQFWLVGPCSHLHWAAGPGCSAKQLCPGDGSLFWVTVPILLLSECHWERWPRERQANLQSVQQYWLQCTALGIPRQADVSVTSCFFFFKNLNNLVTRIIEVLQF